MFAVYLFALVAGGGLLAFSLFGESDAHGAHVDHGAHDGNPVQWLSLRTATYFMFAFGGVGAVLSKSWSTAAAPLVLLLAIVAGLGVGGAASSLFAYLRKTESGLRHSDDSFVGLEGRMTVPFSAGGSGEAGKVLVTRGNRTFELLARPVAGARTDPRAWRAVVVVEMSRGTAVVAPSDDPAVIDVLSLNP